MASERGALEEYVDWQYDKKNVFETGLLLIGLMATGLPDQSQNVSIRQQEWHQALQTDLGEDSLGRLTVSM